MRKTVLFLLIMLAGCATSNTIKVREGQISGPKVITLNAPNAPWVIEIHTRLKAKGFKVLRTSTRTRVTEQTASNRIEQFNEAEARYILVIDGYAPNNRL